MNASLGSIIYVGIEDFYKIPVDHYMIYILDRRYILFFIEIRIFIITDKKNLLKRHILIDFKEFSRIELQ